MTSKKPPRNGDQPGGIALLVRMPGRKRGAVHDLALVPAGRNGRAQILDLTPPKPPRWARFLGMLDEDPRSRRYVNTKVDPDEIIVLPQPRRTFRKLAELGLDIVELGLMHPLLVARFTRAEFRRYLVVINELWETDFEVSQFRSVLRDGHRVYDVLLAGERRLRSIKQQRKQGTLRDRKVDVRLCVNVTPIGALFRQYNENIHVSVPEHEQAEAYQRMFALIRRVDPDFPLAEFARRIRHSESATRNAIRFVEVLPRSVQELVQKGIIVYGIGVLMTHLVPFTSEADLNQLAATVATKRMRVPEFRKLVQGRCRDHASGQFELLANLLVQTQERESARANRRRTVEERVVLALHSAVSYITIVRQLEDAGLIGYEDSPYASGSVRTVLRKLVVAMDDSLVSCHRLYRAKDRERLRKATRALPKVLEKLEALVTV